MFCTSMTYTLLSHLPTARWCDSRLHKNTAGGVHLTTQLHVSGAAHLLTGDHSRHAEHHHELPYL